MPATKLKRTGTLSHRKKASWVRSVQIWLLLHNPFDWLSENLPIILPDSTFRRQWDLFILGFVIWNCVSVPYDASFGLGGSKVIKYMNIAIDCMFGVDLCLNFRTAYMNSQGQLVRDGKQIVINYTAFWFWIDLAASMPFELLLEPLNLSGKHLTILAFLKTPRLLRLGRLLRFLEHMKSALSAYRIFRLLGLMLMIAHWMTCIWYGLFSLIPDQEWMFFVMGQPKLDAYITAFYYSVLLIVGENLLPGNNVERIYMIVGVVFGACFYASVVGNMALLVSNMNATVARHKQKKDLVMGSMRYLDVPKDLQQRVLQYFDFVATYSHPGADGMAVIPELPKGMFEDVAAWMHMNELKKVSLFDGCEDAFLVQLAAKIKMEVYMPGEDVFRIGEVGKEMYILCKGKGVILNANQEVVDFLEEHASFGELAILSSAKRIARCVALSVVDVGILKSVDLQALMKQFPGEAAIVRSNVLRKLEELEVIPPSDEVPDEGEDEEELFFAPQGYQPDDEQFLYDGSAESVPQDQASSLGLARLKSISTTNPQSSVPLGNSPPGTPSDNGSKDGFVDTHQFERELTKSITRAKRASFTMGGRVQSSNSLRGSPEVTRTSSVATRGESVSTNSQLLNGDEGHVDVDASSRFAIRRHASMSNFRSSFSRMGAVQMVVDDGRPLQAHINQIAQDPAILSLVKVGLSKGVTTLGSNQQINSSSSMVKPQQRPAPQYPDLVAVSTLEGLLRTVMTTLDAVGRQLEALESNVGKMEMNLLRLEGVRGAAGAHFLGLAGGGAKNGILGDLAGDLAKQQPQVQQPADWHPLQPLKTMATEPATTSDAYQRTPTTRHRRNSMSIKSSRKAGMG